MEQQSETWPLLLMPRLDSSVWTRRSVDLLKHCMTREIWVIPWASRGASAVEPACHEMERVTVRRLQTLPVRLALAGSAALSLSVAMVIGSLAQGSGAPAFADSAAYELYCPGTPVGNIALNGVVTTGTITPASPAPGQQFNLTNYSSTVVIPSTIASAAAAIGNSAITGTAVTKVDATGATQKNELVSGRPHDRAMDMPRLRTLSDCLYSFEGAEHVTAVATLSQEPSERTPDLGEGVVAEVE